MEPLRLLIYAKWSSGKTRLAATAAAVPALSPVAFWSFDKSTSVIDRKKTPVDVFEISNPKQLSEALAALPTKKYQTVVIDTLSELHALMLTHAMSLNKATATAKGREKSDFVPEPLDYGGAQNAVLQLIRKLRDANLNLIALSQDGQITDGVGANERVLYNHAPLSAKTLSLRIPEFFDLVGFGKTVSGKFTVAFHDPSALVMVKDRRECIPQAMTEPTLEKIYSAYSNGKNGRA